MMTCDDSDFLKERLAAIKQIIVAYETAILALLNNGAMQSYTIDTGQSRQTVTRANIEATKKTLDSYYNSYSVLHARIYGCGKFIASPGW